jgi:hypothetical protein
MDENTIETGTAGRVISVFSDDGDVRYTPQSWLIKERREALDSLLDKKELFLDLDTMVTDGLFHDIEDAKEYIETNYSARPGLGYPLLVISKFVLSYPRLESTRTEAFESLRQGKWVDTEVCKEYHELHIS